MVHLSVADKAQSAAIESGKRGHRLCVCPTRRRAVADDGEEDLPEPRLTEMEVAAILDSSQATSRRRDEAAQQPFRQASEVDQQRFGDAIGEKVATSC